jgi:hypothetical protein
MKLVNPDSIQRRLIKWLAALSDVPYIGILFNTWELGNRFVSRFQNKGIYEVCTGSKDFGHKGRFIYGDFSPR